MKSCKYHYGAYNCQRPCYNDTEYCIFHAPAVEKNASEFQLFLHKELENILSKHEPVLDLTGTNFVDDCSGTLQCISNLGIDEVVFLKCTFTDRLDLSHTHFPVQTNFNDCIFYQDANFSFCSFGDDRAESNLVGYASFQKCEFKTRVFFQESEFFVNTEFINTYFQDCEFIGVVFHDAVRFNGASFLRNADYSSAVFKDYAGFYNIKCPKRFRFHDVEVIGMLNLRSAVIGNPNNGDGSGGQSHSFILTNARIHGPVLGTELSAYQPFIADYTEFKDVVNLSNAKFAAKLSFVGSHFASSQVLRNCQLTELDMACASGEKQLGLTKITAFRDNLILDGIVTSNDTWISCADTHGNAKEAYSLRLNSCSFSGPVRIRDNINSIEIYDCLFTSYLYIVGRNYQEDKSLSFELSILRSACLGPACVIRPIVRCIKYCNVTNSFQLYRANLSRASFQGTDLSDIHFNAVKWPYMKRSGIIENVVKQKCIADEPLLLSRKHQEIIPLGAEYTQPQQEYYHRNESNDKLGEIRNQYNQIHKNYEQRKCYGVAAPFKVAEYNIRENMETTGLWEKSILHIYRVMSMYGTNIFLPFIWIAIVLLAPSVIIGLSLYLYSVLVSSDILSFPIAWESISQTFTDVFQLKLAYPFTMAMLEGDSTWISITWFIQKVVIYLLLIQLVFGIRQRIRR